MPRDNIVLQCTECKERNYVTTKNKKKHTGQTWSLRSFAVVADVILCIEKTSNFDLRSLKWRVAIVFVLLHFRLYNSNYRGIVSMVSTSVSKTESPGSSPGTPASLESGRIRMSKQLSLSESKNEEGKAASESSFAIRAESGIRPHFRLPMTLEIRR